MAGANGAGDGSGGGTSSMSGSNSLLLADPFTGEEGDDWWSNAIEEDTFTSPLAFDASENGLWNGRFVPPPPRPPFLDESVAADGLTTCDLCTWAWQKNAYSLDGSIGELLLRLYYVSPLIYDSNAIAIIKLSNGEFHSVFF